MTAPTPTCGTCRFWIADDRNGECHRTPPHATLNDRWGIWPDTKADEWCGEHRPRPEPAAVTPRPDPANPPTMRRLAPLSRQPVEIK